MLLTTFLFCCFRQGHLNLNKSIFSIHVTCIMNHWLAWNTDDFNFNSKCDKIQDKIRGCLAFYEKAENHEYAIKINSCLTAQLSVQPPVKFLHSLKFLEKLVCRLQSELVMGNDDRRWRHVVCWFYQHLEAVHDRCRANRTSLKVFQGKSLI